MKIYFTLLLNPCKFSLARMDPKTREEKFSVFKFRTKAVIKFAKIKTHTQNLEPVFDGECCVNESLETWPRYVIRSVPKL